MLPIWLITTLVTVAMCASVVFWVLYAIFVPRRLAKAGIRIQEDRWDALFMRGLPVVQLQAYATLLTPEERRKPHNVYLLHAMWVILGLFTLVALLFLYNGLMQY